MREIRAFYDTNVLIAFLFREEDRFLKAYRVLEEHGAKGLSIISIHEIHMYSIRYSVEDKFMEIKRLLEGFFNIIGLNQDTCIIASRLRSSFNLPEVNSLIFASAIASRYDVFYTFDRDFEPLNGDVIEGVKVVFLK
ncbi:MAG: type II toxin-antitoxin system VapC family toxin [Candidatus Nezhaarchaeales archaeon]